MKIERRELYNIAYFGAVERLGNEYRVRFGEPGQSPWVVVDKEVYDLFIKVAERWLDLFLETEVKEDFDVIKDIEEEMEEMLTCLSVAVDFNDVDYYYK